MTKSRILVVDDERIVSLDIQGALARLGYEIAGAASTGAQAMELAKSAAPDLVLMDIRLAGEMDGTEAALRISQTVDVPVIFLTAHSDEQTMRRALAASPFGYLIKPFEDRELRGVIELALAKHGAERDLRRARRAAEEADRAKTAFLGTLSHELRTPMNGILGMAELLLMSGLGGEQRETVEHLKVCAQGLTDILNQLLDFSSLEAGVCELGMQEFALAEFLDQATERHRALAAAKGLAFSVEAAGLPERAFGSPARLRQALEFLLDNAVAFTEKGSVTLLAGAEDAADPAGESLLLHLRVADTGPGIAPEHLPRIFDSFTQGEDFLTRSCKGLGLGLAMCRKLAECLGGRVSARSTLGLGSEFALHAPLRRAAQASPGRGPLGGVRVLLAEGPGAVPSPLLQALNVAGGQVLLASGGGEAARILAAEVVEALVFAPSLEIQDALALTRMVRSGFTLAAGTAPILGVMPQANAADRDRCLLAGMDAVLIEALDSLHCIDHLAGLLSTPRSASSINTDRQGAAAQ